MVLWVKFSTFGVSHTNIKIVRFTCDKLIFAIILVFIFKIQKNNNKTYKISNNYNKFIFIENKKRGDRVIPFPL